MEEDGPFVRAIRSVVGRQAPEVEAAMLRDLVQSLQGGSMGKKKERKAASKEAEGTVTEFTITYFDMSALERRALLDLYSDHGHKFGQRHGVEVQMGVITYPTVEQWEES